MAAGEVGCKGGRGIECVARCAGKNAAIQAPSSAMALLIFRWYGAAANMPACFRAYAASRSSAVVVIRRSHAGR